MALKNWKDIKAKKFSPEQLKALEQEALEELREIDLRALREALGITQEELAKKLDVSQGQLSKIERREDGQNRVATIRDLVAALGGEIEVTAVFGKKRIRLACA